jgi:hypothetical protein
MCDWEERKRRRGMKSLAHGTWEVFLIAFVLSDLSSTWGEMREAVTRCKVASEVIYRATDISLKNLDAIALEPRASLLDNLHVDEYTEGGDIDQLPNKIVARSGPVRLSRAWRMHAQDR